MAGSLEFIKSDTASTVTSIEIADCFNDKYDVYKIFVTKFKSSVANRYFGCFLLDSSNSQIATTTYDTASLRLGSYFSFIEDRFTGETGWYNVAQFDNDLDKSMGLELTVFNPYDSSSYTFLQASTINFYSTSGTIGTKYIGVEKTAQQCNGFRFDVRTYSGTNLEVNGIDNITVKVYGVK